MSRTASALLGEAIGTFALCFIGGGAICLSAWKPDAGIGLAGIALAHGLILSIAVSAMMNVSGGHINPAVTIAMLATGRISLVGAIRYIIAQLLGGTVAGLALVAIYKGMALPNLDFLAACGLGTPSYDPKTVSVSVAILAEAIMTFLLLYAVFATAVDPRAPKIGGFGIGLTVAADILVGGPITGASMNPARTFGTGIVAAMTGRLDVFWSQQPVYWIGPIVGGLLAGVLYDRLIIEKRK
ncbi:MAG: aquaporin [Phycisphaerae bacterium]|nr:aquaporin [Phycisphaerae bacterium]